LLAPCGKEYICSPCQFIMSQEYVLFQCGEQSFKQSQPEIVNDFLALSVSRLTVMIQVTVESLRAANGIYAGDHLEVGDTITIPKL
jgi:hypothetical protein